MDWEFKESLPYGYDALEPHIDAETMKIHHTKHHKAYHTKALDALGGDTSKSVEEVLLTDDRPAIQNNAGGFYNHNLFWESLSPNGGGDPSGELLEAINRDFGSVDKFKEEFSNAALTLFGSGWVWLLMDEGGAMEIVKRPNQNHPLCGKKVLLGLDVWEHAYYLKYQNVRPDYVKAFWNVVNWDKVSDRMINSKIISIAR